VRVFGVFVKELIKIKFISHQR